MLLEVGDVIGESEVFDFGGDAGWEGGRVKEGGVGDTGFAVEQSFPDGLDIVAHRSDPTHACDYDSIHR